VRNKNNLDKAHTRAIVGSGIVSFTINPRLSEMNDKIIELEDLSFQIQKLEITQNSIARARSSYGSD
jgi:hypothetical protein